ncbi:SMC-Scp complex subunit ScpB [Agathobaculum sp. LCP25S3_E8]|uniref:SMC-Scp complex subunit ScpB n=1 Tax=Agathobaculum sp. LCP25S3_E8 TaxID=3438735 RepID=UPI003F90DB5E
MTQLEAGLEAVLFAAGDAVPVDRLVAALETSRDALLDAAAALENLYDFENRGIMLLRLEDKLQLCSRPLYAEAARRVTESRKPPSLSAAALEVLTIVAYRQPVTRAFIDQLRGVDSGGTVAGLTEKGLIEEAGRLDVPGRPMLFRTTEAFLRTFGLSGLEELPALPALEENEQMELELEESAEQPPAQMITLTPPVPQTSGGEDTQPPDAPQETE